MSKERKFHNLIEEQNPDEKQELWNRIERALKEEGISDEIDEIVAPKKNALSWKKITAFATSFVLLITVAVLGGLKIFSGKENPVDQNRYCTQDEYTVVNTKKTLKSYAEEIKADLLFFDWYEETEFFDDYYYQLNENQEIICVREEIVNINTGNLVKIYVTDIRTKLDILTSYEEICVKEDRVKDVTLYWITSSFRANTYFEYQDYRYYIELETPEDDSAILRLVEELLA